LPILFQKSIGNGIANTFVPKILPIIFGNTLTFLDAMVIVHCSAFALLAVPEQETKSDQLLDQLDIKRLQPMHKTFVA